MGTTPNKKYLIAISPDGVQKTILEYQYPGNAMADSWLQFTTPLADGTIMTDVTYPDGATIAQTITFSFGGDGGGQVPEESDFSVPSWVTIDSSSFYINTSGGVNNQYGGFTISMGSNTGGNQARSGDIQYNGNVLHANQIDTNLARLDITQDGDLVQQGKSDRRLKKNITKIGESLSGLNIYSFEYKDVLHGEGLFQGVMSDEIPERAVIKHADGFDRVDYSQLDVEFKQIQLNKTI
tara:strand:- start:57 stop:770 length:714 start_codon:yes stop_codon:yes gene_type:complete